MSVSEIESECEREESASERWTRMKTNSKYYDNRIDNEKKHNSCRYSTSIMYIRVGIVIIVRVRVVFIRVIRDKLILV